MKNKILFGVLVLLLVAAPYFVYPILMMKLLCFALFACAFNLLIGYTGLLSFGHATFFGGAGYVCGYLLQNMGWPLELGLLAGVMAAALIGLVMGGLAIRRQGIYFTMITLALAQMLYFVGLQVPYTGGEDGLQGIPRGHLMGMLDLSNDMAMYFVVLAIVLGAYLLVARIVHSPFGQILTAIKENEARAISLGYDVDRYKLLAFVLSAAIAGLAGATKSVALGLETLTDMHWSMSGLVVLMTLIGGLGTKLGPAIGAVIVILLEEKLGDIGTWLADKTTIEWFRSIGESVSIVIGLIFIICVLLFRRGLVGEWNARLSGQASAKH